MQEPSFSLDHPVVRCAGELNAALDRVEVVDPMYMPAPAKAAALLELTRISSRVQVLLGRVLASADDVATLLKLTERYCVVLQTIRSAPTTSVHVRA